MPVGAPAARVPAQHGLRLHNQQAMAPSLEPAAHQNPEAPIPVPENGTFALALQHYELLTQTHDFGDEPPARLKHGDDEADEPAHGEGLPLP